MVLGMSSRAALVYLAAAVLVLTIACESEPEVTTQDSPLKIVRTDDYFLIVRFMDETTLRARYGRTYNPFISVSDVRAMPRDFMVFKLNVEEVKKRIKIIRKDIEFSFEGKNVDPVSDFNLLQYWEREQGRSGNVDYSAARRRDAFIRAEIFPKEVLIPPGGGVSGLLVFSANFARYGEGRLTIPIYDENERPLERQEISFQF
jgi:hypothetical protein